MTRKTCGKPRYCLFCKKKTSENDNLFFNDSIIFSWPEADNNTIDLCYKIYYQIDNGEYKYYKTVNQNNCTILTDIINPDEVNDFDLRIKVVPNNLLLDGDPLYSNTYTRAKFDAYDPDIRILSPDSFEIGKVTGITWKPYKYKNYSYFNNYKTCYYSYRRFVYFKNLLLYSAF